jgi:hypothetical protein
MHPMPTKQAKNSDRPLTDVEAKEVKLSIARGYKALKLDPKKASSEKTQEAIQKMIDPVFFTEQEGVVENG